MTRASCLDESASCCAMLDHCCLFANATASLLVVSIVAACRGGEPSGSGGGGTIPSDAEPEEQGAELGSAREKPTTIPRDT